MQVFLLTFIFSKIMSLFFKKRTVIPRNVFKDFQEFLLDGTRKREWAESTETRWITFRKHLEKFDKHLRYEKFTEEGLDEFVSFLTNDLELRNSTVSKELKLLRWFLKWAENKGYNRVHDYASYHPKLKMVRNSLIFLTKEELSKLYRLELPSLYPSARELAWSRDMFCFCCFTSLRYSDMINLSASNIHHGKVVITTQKTNDTLSIEINEYAASILERYLPGKKGDEKIFPHLTNCQLNLNIKTLGLICDFNDPQTRVFYRGRKRLERTVPKWECLSTHCARRTFICNALSSGVNAPTIMKWTGHSDYSAMKPYIDVTDRDKEDSMKRIFSNVI